MASSLETQAPLRGKLSRVKYLLEDATKRLQEEATKYEIFATKTSAIATTSTLKQCKQEQDFPNDLIRTMSDINTLESVLSCPIFNRIVNVTDSLDKLSYHLNLHPSIGPADINIDSNGELKLAPPIESTSLNNLINSKLDVYSDRSNTSPQIMSPNRLLQQNSDSNILTEQIIQQPSINSTDKNNIGTGIAYEPLQQQNIPNNHHLNGVQTPYETKLIQSNAHQNYQTTKTSTTNISYNPEKLVSNGTTKSIANKDSTVVINQTSRVKGNSLDENLHLQYNENGNNKQHVPTSCLIKSSTNYPNEDLNLDSRKNGYSNELYKTTQELKQKEAIEQSQRVQNDAKLQQSAYITKNVINQSSGVQYSSIQFNRGSCSPSTSAGSTVRLADECDSGASSYQSQTTKGQQFSADYANRMPEPNAASEPITAITNETNVECLDQELVKENTTPDMERIKVTLEKDENGLGITIAGYQLEEEKESFGEICGIFVKSVTPGSPADKCGKIRDYDQILAVDGKDLLGYSNPQSTNELRRTGKVVTLELMRYLNESKYKRLRSELARIQPLTSADASLTNKSDEHSSSICMSPTKSSIPVYKMRDIQSPVKSNESSYSPVSPNQQLTNDSQVVESIYKNDIVLSKNNTVPVSDATSNNAKYYANQLNSRSKATNDILSHIPVAAQRGGSNKVIETKQGARNTIDIRSPVYQTTTAKYVNKFDEVDLCDPAKKGATRLQSELSNHFGKLMKAEEPEWEKNATILRIYKDNSQGLGLTVKDYISPKDPKQLIIMVTSITPGGIAERDGRLKVGDLLIFVDDTNLEGASLEDAVKALKKASGYVQLGVLKLKRV